MKYNKANLCNFHTVISHDKGNKKNKNKAVSKF